jgi:hypothetical protein
MSTDLDIRLERIGSRIYDDFRAGVISFEVCEASLASLSQVADATELGIPEQDDYETRVSAYEEQGCTRSDAQAIVDTEDLKR